MCVLGGNTSLRISLRAPTKLACSPRYSNEEEQLRDIIESAVTYYTPRQFP